MSAMQQQNPLDSIIGADFEKDLARRIPLAEEWLQYARGLLRKTQQASVTAAVSSDPQRYAAFKGKNAVLNACQLMFTIFQRAMAEEEIVGELLRGGMVTGGKTQTEHQKAWNIRQALSAYARAKTLEFNNGKYGLPGWGKERF